MAILLLNPLNVVGAEVAATEVKITADGNVNYDLESNTARASKNVVLIKGDITINCQELFYNGRTGEVEASGQVKITTSQFSYESENVNFNLNDNSGNLDAFKGNLKGEKRDYLFSGESARIFKETETILNATMTRCPKPQPEYIFTAAEIKYTGQQVQLRKVKLLVKGIPLFYYPSISFRTDDRNLPDIKLDYNNEDGLKASYEYTTPVIGNRSWRYRGELSTKGTSAIGFGMGLDGKNVSNKTDLLYDLDGFWKLEDRFNYNTRLFNLSLDGFREFSDAEKAELGFRLTRKFWKTPVGRWQLGILARDVFAYDSSGQEYGGTYWGYQFDYNPSKYLSLSYLWLDSLEENTDYRDFLGDYKIGSNYLYNVNIPISTDYSLVLDGTYNTDQSEKWVRRFYRIKYETCCLRLTAGWNDLDQSFEFSGSIKF